MNIVLAIGVGGGVGALMRHAFNGLIGAWLGTGFPYGIMVINIFGSMLMGLLIGLFAHVGEIPQIWKLFLTTGILGGFTTFSTFSLDSVLLMERGQYGLAAFYIAGSVVISLAALMLALWGTRLWLT